MSSFTKDAVERLARTVVQVAASVALALFIDAGNIADMDWTLLWQAVAFAAIATVLTALAGKTTGSPDDASFQGGGK
jgi:hypothetical protein